jgi:hypothetical protein
MNTDINILKNKLQNLKILKEKALKNYLTCLTECEKTLYIIQGLCKHIWILENNTYKCKICLMNF